MSDEVPGEPSDAALTQGEFQASSSSFALAERVLDRAIAQDHNGWISLAAHTATGTTLVAGVDGRPDRQARLDHDAPSGSYRLVEDATGTELALLVLDEADVERVDALAFDGWTTWIVTITVRGGTRYVIGTFGSVG